MKNTELMWATLLLLILLALTLKLSAFVFVVWLIYSLVKMVI